MPGMAASTSDTWVLGSAPNVVGAPENNLASEMTWAWTSSPSTISQSPVSPLMSDMRVNKGTGSSGSSDTSCWGFAAGLGFPFNKGKISVTFRNHLAATSQGDYCAFRNDRQGNAPRGTVK